VLHVKAVGFWKLQFCDDELRLFSIFAACFLRRNAPKILMGSVYVLFWVLSSILVVSHGDQFSVELR
jgi:high-affinity Fe2+/Pb2+ permease